uniref:BRCA1-associated ATM activator 1 n=1 Tax=Neogobius melanostomus TaxID=47308 RepID=A0A8C6TJ83_9GOBI
GSMLFHIFSHTQPHHRPCNHRNAYCKSFFNTKHWQESSLWDDPSVKSGWVHGLRSMMQHPRALSFFVQSELMDQLLKLQTDPSLFVASSANQLLVHILLFYQPPATNGKHPTPEVEDRTHNGVEPPPFSSTDYNAVVMAICVYLRESLPPKEQMNLQDSARLLKLVAQILSEASPPLWGQLFEAACGSLEDLVAAGYSQLTLPLIEVILVAHRYVQIKVTVLHKCYQGLLKWTGSSTNRSLISVQLREGDAHNRCTLNFTVYILKCPSQSVCPCGVLIDLFLSDLAQLVSKRVCDLRWEVRDSTVEFLGQQATQTSFSVDPCQSSPLLLEERSTVPLLREALQDQESYVRASAVSALFSIATKVLFSSTVCPQADIVTKLLEILCEDTEGFSRRAVVQFFTSWFSHTSSSSSSLPPLLMTSVPSVLSRGSSDLDWEVKVHALELAKLLMDSTLTGHTGAPHPYAAMSRPTFSALDSSLEDALKKLVDSGVVSALLSGLFDCDRPVGLKACQLLIRLRETLETSAEESAVKCGLPSFGWGLEIRALVENLSDAESVNVREVLRCLDLEGRLDFLSQSSDHVQNSPLSLLKDILTARGVHSHPNAGEGQEVIVDCY